MNTRHRSLVIVIQYFTENYNYSIYPISWETWSMWWMFVVWFEWETWYMWWMFVVWFEWERFCQELFTRVISMIITCTLIWTNQLSDIIWFKYFIRSITWCNNSILLLLKLPTKFVQGNGHSPFILINNNISVAIPETWPYMTVICVKNQFVYQVSLYLVLWSVYVITSG